MSLILNSLVQAVDNALPRWMKSGLKKVSADRWAYRTLKRFSSESPQTVTIQSGPLQGRQFTCSLKYERGYWLGTYERRTQRILTTFLQPGGTFFDIGAHKGYMSLLAATLVGPTGQVVAFEPNASNFAALQQNLALNPDIAPRIRPEFLAIADHCGTQLFQGAAGSTMGRLVDPNSTAAATASEVPTTTLDAYVERTGLFPTFLKMDIEGYEETAMQCVRQTLSAHRPPLWIEIHHDPAARGVLSALDAQEYAAFSLVDGQPTPYAAFTGREQILCLPRERASLAKDLEDALVD